MRIAIHQPQYMPWLGYFDKIDRSDLFVLLDDVQYKKNEWQNRNKIKSDQGPVWLTVPVRFSFGQTINEVAIDQGGRWGVKHRHTLAACYGKAPFFAHYNGQLCELLEKEWQQLGDLSCAGVELLVTMLGMRTEIIRSSSLMITARKSDRLIEICRRVGATHYLSGAGGRAYLDCEAFRDAGVTVEFQEFVHPVYRQRFGAFMPNLSIVDLLFNEGANSLSILRGGCG